MVLTERLSPSRIHCRLCTRRAPPVRTSPPRRRDLLALAEASRDLVVAQFQAPPLLCSSRSRVRANSAVPSARASLAFCPIGFAQASSVLHAFSALRRVVRSFSLPASRMSRLLELVFARTTRLCARRDAPRLSVPRLRVPVEAPRLAALAQGDSATVLLTSRTGRAQRRAPNGLDRNAPATSPRLLLARSRTSIAAGAARGHRIDEPSKSARRRDGADSGQRRGGTHRQASSGAGSPPPARRRPRCNCRWDRRRVPPRGSRRWTTGDSALRPGERRRRGSR